MKQILVNAYALSELSEEVRKEVINRHREINVRTSDWFIGPVEDLRRDLASLGMIFQRELISFSRTNGWFRIDDLTIDFGNENLMNALPQNERQNVTEAFRLAALIEKPLPQTSYTFIKCSRVNESGFMRTSYTEEKLKQVANRLTIFLEDPQLALKLLECSTQRLLIEKIRPVLKKLEEIYQNLTCDVQVAKTLEMLDFSRDGHIIRQEPDKP